MTADEIARTIEIAAARHGVPTDALMAIANLESSGNINADNPRSSASGLFQFVDSTAREYGLTGNKRNDPVAQADAAAKMMATNARALTQTLGREPNAGELYLAHQQGLGGARALLSNPNRPAVDVLTDVYGSRERATQAVRLNGGQLNQSAGQFAGQWVNKANQRAGLIPPGQIPNVVASQTDTQRPDIVGTSQWPTSAASRQVPTRSEAPRISPEMDGVFAYTPPGMERAHIAAGMGSLTPDFFRREVPLPQTRPERAQTASVTMPTPMPDFSPSTTPRRLPPIAPPAPMGSDRVISASMDRAGAARDPALEAALTSRVAPPSMIPASMQRAAEAVDPALQRALAAQSAPGVGMPPATRSVASVPIPAPPSRPTGPALSRDSVAQSQRGDYMALAWPNIQVPSQSPPMPATAMASTIPGPASVFKTADALPAGVFPQVATELDTAPPADPFPVMGFPTSAMFRPPQSVTGFPTAAAQRPQAMPRMSLASLAMPTPVERRPNPNALRVTVNGAGSYRSGGGGGSSKPSGDGPRFVLASTGQEVRPVQTQHYNTDTNKFENRTVYR